MNVWHLVFRTESLTYTVAKALSVGGHDVFVWVVNPEFDAARAGGIQKRLRDTPHVRIVAGDDSRLPSEIDRLIVQVHPRPTESLADVDPLASRARRITLITAGDRSRAWREAMKLQWFETRRLARHADRIDRVLYKDGFHPFDLHRLSMRRLPLGFDAHSHFLHDPEAFRAIHARDWDPDARRPIRANFLGSKDPAIRTSVLDTVRPLFRRAGENPTPASTGKSMFWHEYSDAAPDVLDPLEFVKVLTRSDFTLCPRGYSRVTHRPIEALLRGSIPVLAADELDLYGIPLEEGVNCVGVPRDEWARAVAELADFGEQELARMRANIHAMFARYLDYAAISQGIRVRLGIGS